MFRAGGGERGPELDIERRAPLLLLLLSFLSPPGVDSSADAGWSAIAGPALMRSCAGWVVMLERRLCNCSSESGGTCVLLVERRPGESGRSMNGDMDCAVCCSEETNRLAISVCGLRCGELQLQPSLARCEWADHCYQQPSLIGGCARRYGAITEISRL